MKKGIALMVIAAMLAVAISIGVSYALWTQNNAQTNESIVESGCFSTTFAESGNINLANQYPISDDKGFAQTPYTFTITNTCTIDAQYSVDFETLTTSTMSTSFVKIGLTKTDTKVLGEFADSGVANTKRLTTGWLQQNESVTYSLRLWITESATNNDVGGKTFNGRIVINNVAGDRPVLAAEYIEGLLAENPTTMNNDDPDGNVRYMGTNPNNYVTFNGESWRIIGVFDVAANKGDYDAGITEKRIKLIRTDSIGEYSWDSSDSTINNGSGVNEWSQADLMTTLNSGAYYNRTSGTCYNSNNNGTTTCDFSSTGLTSDAKVLISDAYWNTGTISQDWNSVYLTTTLPTFYAGERSTNNGKICSGGTYCNDTVTRTTGWVGKVGLMYPSDYGYATSGGATTNRATCLSTALYSWNNSSDCYRNSWLYNSSSYQWMMTPVPQSMSCVVFLMHVSGLMHKNSAGNAYLVRPVVYLNSSVYITGGDGTSGNAFQLSL